MFITYKVTNVITGGYYIGSHKTDDPNDDYLGSGKLIRDSIEIYGVENHKKEILGIFETRKESTDLEHALIKQKKESGDKDLLNLSFGGFSFDYINENLTFDRAAFGRLAVPKTKATNAKKHKKLLAIYYSCPIRCKRCGKVVPWERRENSFCSQSCAATYNNSAREAPVLTDEEAAKKQPRQWGRKKFTCPACKKELLISLNDPRKFCSRECSNKGQIRKGKGRKEGTIRLLQDIEMIKQRRNTGETLYSISLDYGVSENQVKDVLKGRIV